MIAPKNKTPKYAPGKCAHCEQDYGEHNAATLHCPKEDGWAETKYINIQHIREMEGGQK